MRLLETSLVLFCICLCLAQKPVPKDDPDTKPTQSPGTKAATEAIVEEMQGTWRLVSMESLALQKQRRQEVGFMVVGGSYFSFELHFGWASVDGNATQRSFISGTHRFEIDERGMLIANSVIGSAIDNEGRILFEQPGRRREYKVDCAGNHLKLKREDGTTFEFERMGDSRVKRDIYGRPVKPKEAGDAGKGGKEAPPKKD